jgi:hypothetical protein
MITTEGFYKQSTYLKEDSTEGIIWEYAPNFVYAPDYTLEKELKDTYKLPIDGWNWYDEQPYITEENE